MISMRSKITQAVLSYFMTHEGDEYYVNELSRKLNLDDGNLSRKLRELKADGLLKSREVAKSTYYSLNLKHPLYSEYKKIVSQSFGLEKELKENLSRVEGITKAWIFGSYAEGKSQSHSDIDLLIVGDQNTLDVIKAIAPLQEKYTKEINFLSYSEQEFDDESKKKGLIHRVINKKMVSLI